MKLMNVSVTGAPYHTQVRLEITNSEGWAYEMAVRPGNDSNDASAAYAAVVNLVPIVQDITDRAYRDYDQQQDHEAHDASIIGSASEFRIRIDDLVCHQLLALKARRDIPCLWFPTGF